MPRRFITLTLAVSMAVLAACSSSDDDTNVAAEPDETTTVPESTTTTEETTTTAEEAPATSALTVPDSCVPADQGDVDLITAGLSDDAVALGQAFVVERDDGRMVGANIFDAEGDRLSSADYWLVGPDGSISSLSSSAEDYSSFERHPDGPGIAGGPDGEVLTDCIVAQLRMENTSG